MVTQIDRLPEDMHTDDHGDQTGPAEEPGQNRCEGEYVDQEDRDGIGPSDLTTNDRVRK